MGYKCPINFCNPRAKNRAKVWSLLKTACLFQCLRFVFNCEIFNKFSKKNWFLFLILRFSTNFLKKLIFVFNFEIFNKFSKFQFLFSILRFSRFFLLLNFLNFPGYVRIRNFTTLPSRGSRASGGIRVLFPIWL